MQFSFFSVFQFFDFLLALRLRVCRCFRFWDPTGSLLDAGLSFWHRRGSFWDSFLGSRLANDPSLASVFSFQKNLRQELSFLRPAQDLHTFFDYLFVLILGVLVFAPAAATPPGSSLGKLSGVALLGWFVSASSILVIRVVNLIDVGQGYMITKRSSHRAQGLLK